MPSFSTYSTVLLSGARHRQASEEAPRTWTKNSCSFGLNVQHRTPETSCQDAEEFPSPHICCGKSRSLRFCLDWYDGS